MHAPIHRSDWELAVGRRSASGLLTWVFAVIALAVAIGAGCNTDMSTQTGFPAPGTGAGAGHIPGGFYAVNQADMAAWVWIAGTRLDQGSFDVTGVLRRFDTDGWPMTCDGRIYNGYVDEVINGRRLTVVSVEMSPALTLGNGSSGPGVTVRYELRPQPPSPNDLLPINNGTATVKYVYVGQGTNGSVYGERDCLLGNTDDYGIEVHSREWLRTSQAQAEAVCP